MRAHILPIIALLGSVSGTHALAQGDPDQAARTYITGTSTISADANVGAIARVLIDNRSSRSVRIDSITCSLESQSRNGNSQTVYPKLEIATARSQEFIVNLPYLGAVLRHDCRYTFTVLPFVPSGSNRVITPPAPTPAPQVVAPRTPAPVVTPAPSPAPVAEAETTNPILAFILGIFSLIGWLIGTVVAIVVFIFSVLTFIVTYWYAFAVGLVVLFTLAWYHQFQAEQVAERAAEDRRTSAARRSAEYDRINAEKRRNQPPPPPPPPPPPAEEFPFDNTDQPPGNDGDWDSAAVEDDEVVLRARRNREAAEAAREAVREAALAAQQAAWKQNDNLALLNLTAMPKTREELKAAYRKRSMTAHPDKGGSHNLFSLVKNAYDDLNKAFN